jgi:tRNA uridine 5-carboxymethylaminomethyl modification enzyme
VGYADVVALPRIGTAESGEPLSDELVEQAAAQLEISAVYSGYIKRQTLEIERQRRHVSTRIPQDCRMRYAKSSSASSPRRSARLLGYRG